MFTKIYVHILANEAIKSRWRCLSGKFKLRVFQNVSLGLGFNLVRRKLSFPFKDGTWTCKHGYTHKPSKNVHKFKTFWVVWEKHWVSCKPQKGIMFQTEPQAYLSLWKPQWNPYSMTGNPNLYSGGHFLFEPLLFTVFMMFYSSVGRICAWATACVFAINPWPERDLIH